MTAVAYVVAYALLSTGGVLLLRTALNDLGDLTWGSARALLGEPSFLLGFLLYAVSFFTWLLALRRYEVVAIFPVFVGVGYVCVVLGAYLFLEESLSPARVAGILVILGGVALIAR
jgi:multidrug transporter EmrE-like cation transporter